MAPRIVAQGLGIRALWPIAAVGLSILAAPGHGRAASARTGRRAGRHGQARREGGDEGPSRVESQVAKAKSESKAKPEAKTKPQAKTKTEAKSEAQSRQRQEDGEKTRQGKVRSQAGVEGRTGQSGRRTRAAGRRRLDARAAEGGRLRACRPPPGPAAQPQALPAPANTIITAAAIDVSAVKRAIEMVRLRKASRRQRSQKEHLRPSRARNSSNGSILRSDDSGADFARYAAFISANPHWPSIVTLRRKAEAAAFQDKPSDAQVLAYFAQNPPLTAKGRFAFARALLASGNRKDAEAQVRDAWRSDAFSQDVENRVIETFGDMLTNADHKARMDRRLYEKDDTEAGLRAARRLGGNEIVIAKARIAMLTKGGNKAALDAVPAAARNDIGYKFARIQMLRRADNLAEAVALIKTVPQLDKSHDLDEWWLERRAAGPQAARRRQAQGRLRGRAAARRRRKATTTAPSISSWPAGSRCAS